MPMLIQHIDAIARKLQRDVLMLTFGPAPTLDDDNPAYEFSCDPIRKDILAWLDQMGIGWSLCGDFASECGFRSYRGQVYLDVPFDPQHPQYAILLDQLEHPDGSMKIAGIDWYIVTLEQSMKNAHHDEPGFWERWAENF